MAAHRWDWTTAAPPACLGCFVSVGNFDGVHLGHAALIRGLASAAAARGLRPAVVVFDPHPLSILRPADFLPTLTTVARRAEYLQIAGVGEVVILQTCSKLLKLGAVDFFNQVLSRGLQVRGLVEGPNFRFGRDREGDVELLARLCGRSGLSLHVVPPQLIDGAMISSSRIRHLLQAGDPAGAQQMLSRPYCLDGIVTAGQRRGQTIGFPTANLDRIETLIPADGVYAAYAQTRSVSEGHPSQARSVSDGYPAAVNIGPNPTFGESARKVEAHLIGFDGDLVGQRLTLDFLARIRDVHRFDSAADLARQIASDVEAVVGGQWPVAGGQWPVTSDQQSAIRQPPNTDH